ncbi:MAG TPA: hypothetical protein VK466_14715, partial [Terriglobales bacterium]|nr:hypothetical protein [Terriglobales bacterium]
GFTRVPLAWGLPSACRRISVCEVMELLLNLIWLLLVVPAYLLWRSGTRRSDAHRSGFVLLVLACTLAILFPVVSASDDIQAMRPEMEEASTRDTISSSHYSRFLSAFQHSSSSAALQGAPTVRHPEIRACGTVLFVCTLPAAPARQTLSARAPPAAALS